MIDTIEQTTCKACGKPLEQAERRGPRRREYCDATCRQRAYRAKQQPAIVTRSVTMSEAMQSRIAELEHEVQALQERLDIEQRYRTDTQVRHFKIWLCTHPQPQDSDFLKRFLADTRLPQHASRSLYAARLKQYGLLAEDNMCLKDKESLLFKSFVTCGLSRNKEQQSQREPTSLGSHIPRAAHKEFILLSLFLLEGALFPYSPKSQPLSPALPKKVGCQVSCALWSLLPVWKTISPSTLPPGESLPELS